MLHLLKNISKNFVEKCINRNFYRDFYRRKYQIETMTREQTISCLIPQIITYFLETDNYLISSKQAERIARLYLAYFKYKDLYYELDNYTESLW